jgi:alanine-alpha-ketoisovalerate/valine-pyruvate aminotransferase
MAGYKYSTQQIVDALESVNGMIYLAARKLGCTPQTIYNRMAKSGNIKEACENSRGELVDLSEQKLRMAVLNGEPWAVALVLKTLGKKRGYVERTELTGADGTELIKTVGFDTDKV